LPNRRREKHNPETENVDFGEFVLLRSLFVSGFMILEGLGANAACILDCQNQAQGLAKSAIIVRCENRYVRAAFGFNFANDDQFKRAGRLQINPRVKVPEIWS
jgi:hypothetical protein